MKNPKDDKEIIRELQKALFYWMPSIAGEDSLAGQKAAEHAYLLIGLDDNSTDCEGNRLMQSLRIRNQALERIELACQDAGCPEGMEFEDFIGQLASRASSGPDSAVAPPVGQHERAAFGDALFDYGMSFSTSVEPGEIKAARERVVSMFVSRVAGMLTEEEVIAAAETSWSTISFDEDGHSIYHFEKNYLQRFAKNLFAAAEAKSYATADDLDAEIHRLLELKIERFPEYAKSLLEGYATKVEVFDHMIKVAQAAGFESLTEAISVAKKARAASSQAKPFEWPPLPAFPKPFLATPTCGAIFTEHQMQGYANAYGEIVRAALQAAPEAEVLTASATPSDEARDAARYRWLVKNCFDWAAPSDGDSFDHIELHFEHEFLSRDDDSVGVAIDSEIFSESMNAESK